MPQRLILPLLWLERHVRLHPSRLAMTAIVVLLTSLAMLGYAINESWQVSRQGRIDNCIAVNELSRKIYVTLGDFGVPMHERRKFLPTENCAKVP